MSANRYRTVRVRVAAETFAEIAQAREATMNNPFAEVSHDVRMLMNIGHVMLLAPAPNDKRNANTIIIATEDCAQAIRRLVGMKGVVLAATPR